MAHGSEAAETNTNGVTIRLKPKPHGAGDSRHQRDGDATQ
jgi:hypothetical protein